MLGQGPSVLPNVHLLLHGQEHINAPLLLAAGDVFTINEPSVQDEQFDTAVADVPQKILYQLVEHWTLIGIARDDGQARIDVTVAAQM